MPRPVILLVVAYGAGLATGLTRFGDPPCAVIAGLATVLVLWRLGGVGLAAALAGALVGGMAAHAERYACTSRLAAGRVRLTAVSREVVSREGGIAPAALPGAGCRGSITVRWPAGRRRLAGSTWLVEGKWIPLEPRGGRDRGILTVESASAGPGRPAWGSRLRTWSVETTGRLYGQRAPLVDALVLNRRGDLDPDLREAYAQSGLVHILSISGFHVGLIAGWLFLLSRAAGLRRDRALLLAALLSTAYVAFIGWPAPATRAAALLLLLALSRWRQRRVQPDALLALTCAIVVTVDPWAILHLSLWLSAAALWGVVRFTRWGDLALGPSAGWRTLMSSVGATLATAPLTAGVMGTVAIVGIGLNFLALPLAALAVPGVLGSLLVTPLSAPLAGALAAGAGTCLALLDTAATLGAKVPGGHLVLAGGLPSAAPWVGLLVFAMWTTGQRNPAGLTLARWGLLAVTASWATLFVALAPLVGDRDSGLALHFLPVGQGDGALLRTPGGHWVMIDAGPRTDHADAGRSVMVPFLRRHGVRRLSALIVSHAHADHVGGAEAVLERFPADLVLEPGELYDDPVYLEFLNLVSARGLPWRAARAGDRWAIDSVAFTVLHPDTAWTEWGLDLNEDSIVLLVRYRGFAALFMGDAGLRAETRLAGAVGEVDLLKVGHHGSRTATGDAWLDRVRPRAAVISVGRKNRYGHPAPETLRRLAAHGAHLWRTDLDGGVDVVTDGHTMNICARRGCERTAVE